MMTSELSNKVALVTGGASGIGRASVLALSGAGAAVAVLDRDEAGATAVVAQVKKLGGHASMIVNHLSHTERIADSVVEIPRCTRSEMPGEPLGVAECSSCEGDHRDTVDLGEKTRRMIAPSCQRG